MSGTHVINEYEVEEDGLIYIVQELSNGGTIKILKPSDEPLPYNPENDILNEDYEAQLEMQANIQYLVDIAEINMEG